MCWPPPCTPNLLSFLFLNCPMKTPHFTINYMKEIFILTDIAANSRVAPFYSYLTLVTQTVDSRPLFSVAFFSM